MSWARCKDCRYRGMAQEGSCALTNKRVGRRHKACVDFKPLKGDRKTYRIQALEMEE